MPDLSWLETATPVEATFQKNSRGRQPGKNFMDAHVVKSYGAPKPLALEIPADAAQTVERLIRKAGTAHKWMTTVQVLRVNPETATEKDLIPLRELKDLKPGTDVWITWLATDRPEPKDQTETPTAETATSDAPADPFAGTPTETADGDANTTVEDEPETKTGKFGRKTAVRN